MPIRISAGVYVITLISLPSFKEKFVILQSIEIMVIQV